MANDLDYISELWGFFAQIRQFINLIDDTDEDKLITAFGTFSEVMIPKIMDLYERSQAHRMNANYIQFGIEPPNDKPGTSEMEPKSMQINVCFPLKLKTRWRLQHLSEAQNELALNVNIKS